jgi:hypothetical protein
MTTVGPVVITPGMLAERDRLKLEAFLAWKPQLPLFALMPYAKAHTDDVGWPSVMHAMRWLHDRKRLQVQETTQTEAP